MKKGMLILFLTIALFNVSQLKSQVNTKDSEPLTKITAFPNPATRAITILGLQNTKEAIIVVYDTYGTSVLRYKWEIKNNALTFPIANLEKGIYLVTIVSEEQQIKTKFLKQ